MNIHELCFSVKCKEVWTILPPSDQIVNGTILPPMPSYVIRTSILRFKVLGLSYRIPLSATSSFRALDVSGLAELLSLRIREVEASCQVNH